ncbi:uncharacterized protein C2orf78 homolog [Psammomys obesus]|uniref:uncharacterized protein C2orf78 homolog n=1 Tax=Psammomys obesus TaxID=48139 RepID=UPI00245315BC|nr:uncharacterized protein C2orf78 homolog [Psammomys obesus]
MSENFQTIPFFGTESALQPSLPVLSNSRPSAGREGNFPRVSTPACSSAGLLPSVSNTSLQPIMSSACLYQHAGTTMLTVLSDQSQISTSALSYPGAFTWDLTGSKDRRAAALQDFTVTITDQDTTLSSLSVTAGHEEILDSNAIIPFCPTLSASFVHAILPQMTIQGYGMVPSYQEGSQVYNHSCLDPLTPGELEQGLQTCCSVSYPESQAFALQPDTEMVLKEIQQMNVQIPLFTSAFSYSASAQTLPDTSLQGVEMETTLGLLPSDQTLSLLQSPELSNTCMLIPQMRTSPVNGDRSLTAPIHSPSYFLALPPVPILEQTENKNLEDTEAELSMPLDACKRTKVNQDPALLPLEHPDMQQALHCSDAGSLRKKPASDNASIGGSSFVLEEQQTMDSLKMSTIDFADITTLVTGIHLPQLFNSLTDLEQFQDPTATKSKISTVIRRDQAQDISGIVSEPSDKARKKDHEASELLDGAPQAKIQRWDFVEGEESVGSTVSSERAIDNMANNMEGKAERAASRPRRGRGQEQDITKWSRENSSKKTEEPKQSRNRVKTEEESTMPKTKRKRNPPELSHNSFKRPRTHLGMHMLESVQVFHPLGKKNERKTGTCSSRPLGISSSHKDPRPGPLTTALLDRPHEGQGPEKNLGKAQRAERSAHKGFPTSSQHELPSPGKVKLVPLPFPTLDKPQARPISRKPLSLASHRPTTVYSAQPHSHRAQPTTLGPCQPPPASTSLMASAKAALPSSTSGTQSNVTNPIQSSTVPQSAASRPAPYRASSHTSLQRELVSARNKVLSPPKPQTQYLLQDFSHQPIPWRKVDITGTVISHPITKEQRPEREAMKRRAQLERENFAKYTSSEKLQLFLQREREVEISQYYGYAM